MKNHRLIQVGKNGEVSNPIRKNIAAYLEKVRKSRGLIHEHFWRELRGDDEGFARNTYLDTVRGKNNITLQTLENLSKRLNTSIAELFGVKNPTAAMKSLTADDLQQRLSTFVEQERLTRKMLRKEIAEKMEVSYMTYLKIMRGDGNVGVDTIAGIAKALREDPVTYLFNDAA